MQIAVGLRGFEELPVLSRYYNVPETLLEVFRVPKP